MNFKHFKTSFPVIHKVDNVEVFVLLKFETVTVIFLKIDHIFLSDLTDSFIVNFDSEVNESLFVHHTQESQSLIHLLYQVMTHQDQLVLLLICKMRKHQESQK